MTDTAPVTTEPLSGTALSYLARVTAARAAKDAADLAFDCAVDEAVAAGITQRVVAHAGGLSHTGVAKIVRRLERTAADRHLTKTAGRWRTVDAEVTVPAPPVA